MSWDRPFADPIPLPDGGALKRLLDAGAYISALSEKEHGAKEWQTAMHCLLQAADNGGPIEFARISMMQALYPKGTPVYHYVDKAPKWRNNHKLARDR
ncbi:MAG: hypothetical protein JWR35_3773 [Marmoricola sp.]|nr:hypothetical protein [Marmoricola sp.]